MADILHVIKTRTYKNDSRLLKWISSLNETGFSSNVFIIQDDNTAKKWKDGDVQITASSLGFRKYFKKRKGYFFKIPEFTFKAIKYIRNANDEIIVFHDMQHYLTLLLLCLFKTKRKIVWDLHELPHELLTKYWVSRKVVRFILSSVDLLVYTNMERREYILEKFKHKENAFGILNNYPDKSFFQNTKTSIPTELKEWLQDENYIIWLGNGLATRNFLSFIAAVKSQQEKIKIVVLGKIPSKEQLFVEKCNMKNQIYDVFVDPKEMVNYIDNALFSVVVYKNISPNNWLCEPNRLYQLTSRNIPVITGNNPPLRSFVQKFDAGIVLSDDGASVEELSKSMALMFKEYKNFKKSLESSNMEKLISWENQFLDISKILNNISKLCK